MNTRLVNATNVEIAINQLAGSSRIDLFVKRDANRDGGETHTVGGIIGSSVGVSNSGIVLGVSGVVDDGLV